MRFASRRWHRATPPLCVRSHSLIMGAALLAVTASWPARAEDPPTEPATIRKTKEGLHFNLPPDWPLEKRGGVMAPIPIEEYLAQKFKAIESQLQALGQQLNQFDVRLRIVEEEMKRQRQTLHSSGQAP